MSNRPFTFPQLAGALPSLNLHVPEKDFPYSEAQFDTAGSLDRSTKPQLTEWRLDASGLLVPHRSIGQSGLGAQDQSPEQTDYRLARAMLAENQRLKKENRRQSALLADRFNWNGQLQAELSQRDEMLAAANRRVRELEEDTRQKDELEIELAEVTSQRDQYKRNFDGLMKQRAIPLPPGEDTESPPQSVESVGEAIEAARRHLSYVRVPDTAVTREVLSLETWADDVWQRLQFLNDYAAYAPACNAYEWAKSGVSRFAYGGKYGLAMQESKTVEGWQKRSKSKLGGGKSRWFAVDPAVDPNGEALMFAHFKFGKRSGGETLRIHFYDDVKRSGGTGKVHVGYIGTHLRTESTD